MKRISSLLLYFLMSVIPVFCFAEGGDEGIAFENISFEEALAKARATGRKVFIDCHTKTCGPCRVMEHNVFPQKECGDYMNPRYVCLMQDMEEGEGPELAKRFNVGIYPTFLVINTDGTLCFMEMGSTKTADKFVEKISSAAVLADMNEVYNNGERSDEFMSEYMSMLRQKSPKKLLDVIEEVYMPQGVGKMSSPEVWASIKATVNSADHPIFQYLVAQRNDFIARLGRQEVEQKIMSVYKEELRIFKTMQLDFDRRISVLAQLEKEGYAEAAMLRYGISFRKVINGKLTGSVDELIKSLIIIKSYIPDETMLMSALINLGGIERITSSKQQFKLRNILNDLKADMNETNVGIIDRIISQLKK